MDSSVTNSIVQQCLDVLKRDDIKRECRKVLSPVLDAVLFELNPYIYIIIALIFMIFFIILANLIILIHILKKCPK